MIGKIRKNEQKEKPPLGKSRSEKPAMLNDANTV
jgi:hypothetical protein